MGTTKITKVTKSFSFVFFVPFVVLIFVSFAAAGQRPVAPLGHADVVETLLRAGADPQTMVRQ